MSKISNLLLPLRAGEAEGREFYPTNAIPNKCVCGAFLMISLSILLLFYNFLVPQMS